MTQTTIRRLESGSPLLSSSSSSLSSLKSMSNRTAVLPRVVTLLLLLLLLLLLPLDAATNNDDDNDDDDDPDSRYNRQWEQLLLVLPNKTNIQQNLHRLTRQDHVAGTAGDFATARMVHDQLALYLGKQNVRMERIPVMLSYPSQSATLCTSTGYRAQLTEDILPQDPTSDKSIQRNHTFLAYTPAGRVTAPLVYANYGRLADFDMLRDVMGINVIGAIVMMRYGGAIFRGLKIRHAESQGAIGSILYSDPADDGYSRGGVYPNGPWRPPSSVQRGSAQFISICPGDPWRRYFPPNDGGRGGSEKNTTTRQLCGYDAQDVIPRHPALPISYQDAEPLLRQLGGLQAPSAFQGGLNLTYTVGPSDFDVTLETFNRNVPGEIPNVIATIPGSAGQAATAQGGDNNNSTHDPETDDAPIILGNHRDAWVFGAVDPGSGTAVLLEVARVLGELLSRGWIPRRTVILASWSGEEYGLLGSTAFAESNNNSNSIIMNRAAAYLNVDIAVARSDAQPLTVRATHSLEDLFVKSIQSIPAPNDQGSNNNNNNCTEGVITAGMCRRTMFDTWNKVVDDLGSGSDYTAFLHRFGIASLDMSYNDGGYGVYHSIYDSYSWMTKFGDPLFEYHLAMTRLWLMLAFRLASYEVLPLKMEHQATRMLGDVAELAESAVKVGVDLTRVAAAVNEYRKAAIAIDQERMEHIRRRGGTASSFQGNVGQENAAYAHAATKAADLNRRLAYAERQFLVSPGLTYRPWFRHVLQAPGYNTGYSSQAFPGIADAIETGDVELARNEAIKAMTAIESAARYLLHRTTPVIDQ